MQIPMSMRHKLMPPSFFCTLLSFAAGLSIASISDLDADVDAAALEKMPLTMKQCQNIVDKVQKVGKYTEESIVPVCKEEVKAGGCAFFAEALSLASSHTDFKGETFCKNFDNAQFCSETMDKLLESTAVSDMAFGACERAKPQKDIEYCRKIQQMLALSVKQEDLDTMRACYMMEAYTNQTASAVPAVDVKKQDITVKAESLEKFGKGKPTAPHAKGEEIIAKPVPLESLGDGKSAANNTTLGTIVVEPQPLDSIGKGKGNLTVPTPEPIIAEPIPQPVERFGEGKGNISTTTAVPKDIITEAIPAEQNTIATKGPTVAPIPPVKGSIATVALPNLHTVQTQQKRTVTKTALQTALQQPGQTVFVISVPAAASNATEAASAKQRNEIVDELLAATDTAAKAALAQSAPKVSTAVFLASKQTVAPRPEAALKPSTKVVSNAALPGTSSKSTVSEHVGKVVNMFQDKAVVVKNKDTATKDAKKSDYKGFLSGFVS